MADYQFEGSFEGKALDLGEAVTGKPVMPLIYNDQRDPISGDVIIAGNMAAQQSEKGVFLAFKRPDGSYTDALFMGGQ